MEDQSLSRLAQKHHKQRHRIQEIATSTSYIEEEVKPRTADIQADNTTDMKTKERSASHVHNYNQHHAWSVECGIRTGNKKRTGTGFYALQQLLGTRIIFAFSRMPRYRFFTTITT